MLHHSAPDNNPPVPTIAIDDSMLMNTEDFRDLGSIISSEGDYHFGSLDKEVDAQISKTSQAPGTLRTQAESVQCSGLALLPLTVVSQGRCMADTSRSWRICTCEPSDPF